MFKKLLLAAVIMLTCNSTLMASPSVEETLEKLRQQMAISAPPLTAAQANEKRLHDAGLEQRIFCGHVEDDKQAVINNLNQNVYLLDRNAQILDMSVEYDPMMQSCFGNIVTDHAGVHMVIFRRVELNGKRYINTTILHN